MANRYNEYKLEYTLIVPCSCGCCSDYQDEEDYFDSEVKALESFECHRDHWPKLYKLNEQGLYDLIKEE